MHIGGTMNAPTREQPSTSWLWEDAATVLVQSLEHPKPSHESRHYSYKHEEDRKIYDALRKLNQGDWYQHLGKWRQVIRIEHGRLGRLTVVLGWGHLNRKPVPIREASPGQYVMLVRWYFSAPYTQRVAEVLRVDTETDTVHVKIHYPDRPVNKELEGSKRILQPHD